MSITGKSRSPIVAEVLGGGALVAVATGALVFAVQWGGTLRAVDDHVDPNRHELIVLAGNVETGQKIAVIEDDIGDVKEDVAEAKADAEKIREDVSDIKGDIKVLLRLAEEQARRAREGGPP